jgi:site-specific recombinase XerD
METTTTAVVVADTGAALARIAPELEAARAYAAESHAPRTREAYRYQWQTFAAWCEARQLEALPAEPATLAAYIAGRTDEGWKPASVALALTAIRAAHRAAGLEHAANHPAVVAVQKGARRAVGTVQRRAAPAVVDELRAMVGALPGLADGAPTLGALRDRALLVVGFAGAFRRSELVALDVADVTDTADGLVVTVRRSKTDQEGAGVRVGLPFGGNPATCPVRAVRAWLEAAGITTGALFRAVDRHGHVGERLAGAEVARIVKRSAARAGLDASRYSGHSLRAGLATTAARAGKGDRAIMAQGRWTSRGMVDRYVREARLFADNAAAGVGL